MNKFKKGRNKVINIKNKINFKFDENRKRDEKYLEIIY